MTGITRRLAIPLGLATLLPASGQAGCRCKRHRKKAQQPRGSAGVCTPNKSVIRVMIVNYFEIENTTQVTLTPSAGSPENFTPDAFATTLATWIAMNTASICDLA